MKRGRPVPREMFPDEQQRYERRQQYEREQREQAARVPVELTPIRKGLPPGYVYREREVPGAATTAASSVRSDETTSRDNDDVSDRMLAGCSKRMWMFYDTLYVLVAAVVFVVVALFCVGHAVMLRIGMPLFLSTFTLALLAYFNPIQVAVDNDWFN